MLINLSNHPSSKWSEIQINQAEKLYKQVIDLPFPNIKPDLAEFEVDSLAKEYISQFILLLNDHENENNAVHVMGEYTLTYSIVSGLLKKGIKCISSTTERVVEEESDKKITIFRFIQFREYKNL